MKKLVSLTLAVLVVFTGTSSLASMENKMKNHWGRDMVSKDFIGYYFPYLAKNDFEDFNPDGYILKKDFLLSLASLSKNYDLNSANKVADSPELLTRKEIVDILGKKLLLKENIKYENKELPFKDINTMNKDSIELLKMLYNLDIINGASEDRFAPDKKMTQIEAIVILEKLKGVLDAMDGFKEIPYEINGIVQSYNSKEGIIVKELDNSVYITITKEFATPGYSMDIEKITKEGNQYKIHLKTVPPKEGRIVPQVITYKTMTLEINKDELTEQPYSFTMEGIKSNLSNQ